MEKNVCIFGVSSNSMKQRIKILFSIFFLNFVNAQNSDWTEIKDNYFQKVISENSKELLNNNDKVNLSTFEVEKATGEIENLDFGMFLLGEEITFQEFKSKLNVEDFNPSLKKDSEYLIKIDIPKEKFFEYQFYLNDSTKNSELKKLQEFLKENYQFEKLVYISKKDAAIEAKKELGIDSGELFEENIFPASLELTTKNQIDFKKIQQKFPKIIDDCRSNEREIKSMSLKIKT